MRCLSVFFGLFCFFGVSMASLPLSAALSLSVPLCSASADTQSTGSSAGSGGASVARRTTALRVLELLFPFFRWRSLLLLISIADWAIFITTLALDSEMPLVPSSEARP